MNKGTYFAGVMFGVMAGHALFDYARNDNQLERTVQTEEVYQGCDTVEIHSLESNYDTGVYCHDAQIPVIMIYEE